MCESCASNRQGLSLVPTRCVCGCRAIDEGGAGPEEARFCRACGHSVIVLVVL